MSFVIPALNTVRASRWELLKAKLFGVKNITEEDGCKVVLYKYKGKFYLTKFEESQ